jgi:class 3 adenylate cyclase
VSRRLVAVVFMDLVGWTGLAERLDPEPLQEFMERYYDIAVAAVERNGGIVEKFIGDAIMAVFGAERSGEDDALRALTASIQARQEVSRLAIAGNSLVAPAVHCGIAAGEALVTRSARAGVRIVGDVVNLAARLQSAAPPGEILINEVMAHLVRSHAALVPVPPIRLKGKREPVPAWRAGELAGPPAGPRTGSPMIDRDEELGRLRDAWRTVAQSGRAQAVVVLGQPGIGKSRLVREVVSQVRAERDPAPRTASASSPAVGAAGTYAPLAQVVQALMLDPEVVSSVRAVNGGRLHRVLSRIREQSAAGGDDPAPGAEEISWAMRELLARAATRPILVVWEDLDSAEPALLDIVADLARSLRDRPVLMIAVARNPLGLLPGPGPAGGAPWSLLEVRELSGPHAASLVGQLISAAEAGEVVAQEADVLSRVAEDCAGNPLYAELMVETLALGYALGEVPPTITALIGAMVDRLPPATVPVLEAAAVAGAAFTAGQLAAVGVDPAPGTIDDLVGRQLIEPDQGPGAYRFGQRIVHGVVYGRVDKQRRIGLHRTLADRGVRPGFHLEAVVRLMREIGPEDPELPRLAARAAGALLLEGTYALRRRNLPAAIDLLTRATGLTPDDDAPDDDTGPADGTRCATVATLRLSDALLLAGDLAAAQQVISPPIERAPRSRIGRACQLQRATLTVRAGERADGPLAALVAELRLDRTDHVSWCRLHQLRMLQQIADGRFGAAERSARHALRRARQMSDGYERDRMLAALCEVGQWSPAPIPGKLAFCTELAARFADDRCLLVPVLVAQARHAALTGDLARATVALADARQIVTELRLAIAEVLVHQGAGVVAALAGAHEEAERHFRLAVSGLGQSGHRPATLAVRALAARQRLLWQPDDAAADEVGVLVSQSGQMDLRGRVLTLGAAARVTAAAGRSPGGQAAAALRLLDRTDDRCLRGDVFADLAAAHRRAGDQAAARAMARAAAADYGAVGASLPAQRIREWL